MCEHLNISGNSAEDSSKIFSKNLAKFAFAEHQENEEERAEGTGKAKDKCRPASTSESDKEMTNNGPRRQS